MSPTKAERFYGAGPSRRFLGDGGGLGGIDPGVKLLQAELGKLAAQVGNAHVSPDRTDGTMSLGTIIALSHAAGVLGSDIDPTLGKVLDLVDLIRKPLEPIPYADQVLNLVLSPWIVDHVFDTVIALMRLIPGAGDAATATKSAVDAFEQVLASVAMPLTTVLELARKALVKNPGLGGAHDLGIRGLRGIQRRGLGAGATIQVGGTGSCATNQYRNAAGACVAIPSCPTGQRFIITTQSCAVVQVHEHSAWPSGKPIDPSQWSRNMQYRGRASLADLSPADQQMFASTMVMYANTWPMATPMGLQIQNYLKSGVLAFRTFNGADGSRMGAFLDTYKQTLAIVPLPPPQRGGDSLFGQVANAVGNALDYANDAIGDAANATGDFLSGLWDSISDQVAQVYEAVKKYGCAIVGSDLVVAIAATGAGIIATPAASAAVVTGAAAGRTGCAVLEVGELVVAILRLLSQGAPPPPPLPPTEGSPIFLQSVVDFRLGPASGVLPQTSTPMPIVLGPPTGTTTYPTGSIARFNTTRNVWSIYSPIAGSLGCASCGPLSAGAAAAVTPPVPVGFVKTGEELTPPAGVAQTGAEADAPSIWKNPYFWLAVGGGVVGAGGYLLIRRRRKTR